MRLNVIPVPLVLVAVFTTLLACAIASPAAADFTVCNKSKSRAGVAIGHRKDGEWSTEGWWNLAPGDCKSLLSKPLDDRYYYIFARDWDKGGDWGGTTPMCTQIKVFTIAGVEDCGNRGYDTSTFFEIDTGESKSWTVQLTESGVE